MEPSAWAGCSKHVIVGARSIDFDTSDRARASQRASRVDLAAWCSSRADGGTGEPERAVVEVGLCTGHPFRRQLGG